MITGILGGNVSMWQRYALRDRYLAHLPPTEVGWRNQCRCGSLIRVLWRGRHYCPRCGRWTRELKPKPPPARKAGKPQGGGES